MLNTCLRHILFVNGLQMESADVIAGQLQADNTARQVENKNSLKPLLNKKLFACAYFFIVGDLILRFWAERWSKRIYGKRVLHVNVLISVS